MKPFLNSLPFLLEEIKHLLYGKTSKQFYPGRGEEEEARFACPQQYFIYSC